MLCQEDLSARWWVESISNASKVPVPWRLWLWFVHLVALSWLSAALSIPCPDSWVWVPLYGCWIAFCWVAYWYTVVVQIVVTISLFSTIAELAELVVAIAHLAFHHLKPT